MAKHVPSLGVRKLLRLVNKTSQSDVGRKTKISQPAISLYLAEVHTPDTKRRKRFVKLGINQRDWDRS